MCPKRHRGRTDETAFQAYLDFLLLERIDGTWERHRFYQDVNEDVLRSERVYRHVHGCFIADRFGIEVRHTIGVGQITSEQITPECDYPHPDPSWPKSRAYAARCSGRRGLLDRGTERPPSLHLSGMQRRPESE